MPIRKQTEPTPKLFVTRPERNSENHHEEESSDAPPVPGACRNDLLFLYTFRKISNPRQITRTAPEVKEETEDHANAGGRKTVVPADLLTERPAGKRGQERTHTDTHKIDGVARIAPAVARRVQLTHHCRNIRLKKPCPCDHQGQA